MQQLVKQHNLVIETMKPMWYDSFYVSLLSEKYKRGKANFIKSMWNGFVSNIEASFYSPRCSPVIY